MVGNKEIPGQYDIKGNINPAWPYKADDPTTPRNIETTVYFSTQPKRKDFNYSVNIEKTKTHKHLSFTT
jgi:hypothetical protein